MISTNSTESTKKTLQRILVRFFPPGIILEFTHPDGKQDTKSIDLLKLSEKYLVFN